MMDSRIVRFLFDLKFGRLLAVFALVFTLASCGKDYSVGGSVSGLTGTLVLQNNGGGNLSLTANGTFRFASKLADGKTYAVTVSSQPSGQTCSVTNGSGKIGADITNVSVDCVDNPPDTIYSVGGSVSGLVGTLVLQNNGGGDLSLTANGTFVFPSLLATNALYDVTILTQPYGQTCSVTNGSSTISGANVTNVAVDCVTAPSSGTITGTVSGTVIVAVNDSGTIVASDDTAGKTADPVTKKYPFTLTGIPVGVNIRVYLVKTTNSVFPLYFGDPSTNVFSLSAVADIDLGFVDMPAEPGQATSANDPTDVPGVNPEPENTATPLLPGGILTVNVTDDNTGAPLSGATVIVDQASDPRQVGTTTEEGSVSFITPSAGPVTVTIGMSSGYEIVTIIDINIASLSMSLESIEPDFSAFVQGTATNFIDPYGIVFGFDDFDDKCASCEQLGDGTSGFYRLEANLPISTFNLSAFDFGSDNTITTPINFTAETGIGPLVDGDTLTVDLIFPESPPTTTKTSGVITVPENLGEIDFVVALGAIDLLDNPGELLVGLAFMSTSPYNYDLTTFDFTGAGSSTSIFTIAEGTEGGQTHSIKRGEGFGGIVNFSLINIPTNLSPTGDCGGVAPTFSWTGVAGASFYGMDLNDSDTNWTVVTDGGSTSFALPDLTDTPLAGLGLTASDTVELSVWAMIVPDFNFNSLNKEIKMTYTDRSESPAVSCTP